MKDLSREAGGNQKEIWPIVLETTRLILRPWKESDAEALFRYASDERVAFAAGWQPHKDIGYSRALLRTVLMKRDVFAITLKSAGNIAAGSISLRCGENAARNVEKDEAEIGYWLGLPFWGRGYMTEAVAEVIKFGFVVRDCSRIWCCCADDNIRSEAVMKKNGFVYSHTNPEVYNPLLQIRFREHHYYITQSLAGPWNLS